MFPSFVSLEFKATYPHRNYLGATENPFAPIYETLFPLSNINRNSLLSLPCDAGWMHLVH